MIRIGAPLRMFVGLAAGLAAGIVASVLRFPHADALLAVAQPVGQLWLDALTMTVVPLVFGLLVTGIADAAVSASDDTVAWRALLWFTILLAVAAALAAVATSLLLEVWPVGVDATLAGRATGAPVIASTTDWIGNIIPTNPIRAAADTAMVPIVIFALLFGFATARIDPVLGRAITTFFRAIVAAMLVIVDWVLWIAPLGIAALAYAAGVRMGIAAAGTLIHYVMIITAVCLTATVMAYGAAMLAGRMSVLRFARAALPAQAVAIGTQSSLASLPVMVEAARALGVTPVSAGVVLPLAVSLFRAASVAANVAVAVYLAHLHGIALSFPILALGVLVAIPVSLAAVGLPAQVSFFATIGPICIAMGVPIVALPLLLAVETIPDLFRTLGNVTNDLAVARIVGAHDTDLAPSDVAKDAAFA